MEPGSTRRCLLAVLLALAACSTTAPPPEARLGPSGTVYAVSNGWHVGLSVARHDIPEALLPELRHFTDFDYIQFGWGDHLYYPDPQPTRLMALRAALAPSPAVIHVIGTTRAPWSAEGFEVLALDAALVPLLTAIDATFDRPPGAPAPIAAPGLHPTSVFFPAHGRFHLFNTCNTWSADMLRAGGVDLAPGPIITAEDLMRRLRPLGRAV